MNIPINVISDVVTGIILGFSGAVAFSYHFLDKPKRDYKLKLMEAKIETNRILIENLIELTNSEALVIKALREEIEFIKELEKNK